MDDPASITRSFVLGDGQMITLDPRAGQWLRVAEGRVWLTREGFSGDVFLVAGRRWPIQAPGRVLVEGLDAARLIVSRPATPSERLLGATIRLLRRVLTLLPRGLARRLGARRLTS